MLFQQSKETKLKRRKKHKKIWRFIVGNSILVGLVAGIITIRSYIIEEITELQEKTDPEREKSNSDEEEYGIGGPDLPIEKNKEYPEAVEKLNKEALQILKKIAPMPDNLIKNLLDNIFIKLNKSLEYNDQIADTYYLLGAALVKKGDYYMAINNKTSNKTVSTAINAYEDSLSAFQKAEEYKYTNKTNIIFERGKAYSSLGRIYQSKDDARGEEYFKKAIDDYRFCENNFFTLQNIYFEIADKYYIIGNYQEAIDYYTNSILYNDTFRTPKPLKDILFMRSNAYYLIGCRRAENDDFSSAIQSYILSTNDNPENYDALYELGRAYHNNKMYLESIEQFDLILARHPSDKFQRLAREGRNFAFTKFTDLFKDGIYRESERYEYSKVNGRTFRRDKATKKTLHELKNNEWFCLIGS